MRDVASDTHTWLAARQFMLDRADDFSLQLARVRETFDPEAIHDLRVSSRRLREGMTIFAGCFRKKQLAPIRSELKKFTSLLGSIRNADEALLYFSPLLESSDPGCGTTLQKIVATLREERSGEQRRLKRALQKMDPAALLGRIDEVRSKQRIFDPASDDFFRPVADSILESVAAREQNILDLLAPALKEENQFAQHRLRIAVKRFRYRMEFLAPIATGDYRGVHGAIKGYQDVLGQMHDLDVFRTMVCGFPCGPKEYEHLTRIITGRRRALFSQFLSMQAADPLDRMGDRVRDLL